MHYYGKDSEMAIVARGRMDGLQEITEADAMARAEVLWAVALERGSNRSRWKCDSYSLSADYKESLDSVLFNDVPASSVYSDVPEWLLRQCNNDRITAINSNQPLALKRTSFMPGVGKKINIVGLGDVGGTLAIGMRLLGGDCVREIGIYGGGNTNAEKRWEAELNQILDASDPGKMPFVRIISEDALFDCDIFAFCASAGVPPLGTEVQDVRLVQYEANAAIIEQYAKAARKTEFQGIFAVVSDPVDLLCAKVFAVSNQDETGRFDYKGLLPEQIRGYGLGVMYARAAYYAGINGCLEEYLSSGRVYGPHGEGLIIANSLTDYDESCSQLLTEMTVKANIVVRETGFKPYIAPAISSGALSLLGTIRGDWHYCSTFINGTFLGARNRISSHGIEVERINAPLALMGKIKETYSLVREMSERCCEL